MGAPLFAPFAKGALSNEKARAVLPFPPMKDGPIFAGVAPAEFELITSAAQSKYFSDGEIIFKEGSPIREVALLLTGSVKMSKRGIPLQLIAPGAIIGPILVSFARDHSSTVQAAEDCWVFAWDGGAFERLLRDIPTFRRNIFRAKERDLDEMRQSLQLSKRRSQLSNDDMRRRADKVMALYATLGLIVFGIWEMLKHAYK
jgi:CRP-like cAMP-binding protein